MDIFLPILGLLMIMVFIVGATIRINSLMKGKIINALLNKKLLLLLLLSLGFIGIASAGEIDINISKLKASNACVSCNLNRTYLSKANLKEADLNRAILNYADLREATLVAANLSEARLNGANLSGANLSGANLSGASLSSANLSEVKLCKTIMPNGFTDNSGC